MRFAFVLPNLAGGGAEKAVVKLARALSKRDHATRLILLEDRRDFAVPEEVPVTALAWHMPRGWFGKRLLAHRLRQNLADPEELVVSTLPFADEVTRLARPARHVCRIANTLGAEIDKIAAVHPAKARRREDRYRQLYGEPPLVAVSHGVAMDLRHRLGVRGSLSVIPNLFDFATIRQAAQVPFAHPGQSYVIHVGRFNAQKRHDLLLDAWSRINASHLLILLTTFDPRLQAMIDERGLSARVRIAGFQTNPYPWIAHADLLVLCSDHEGLPNVLIEAIACGTPVVSTDCPSGPREILAELPECLVPCGNAQALAAAIQRTLISPPDVTRIDLSPYGVERVLDAWERLAEAV